MYGILPQNDAKHRIIQLQRPSFCASSTVQVQEAAQAQMASIKKARGERRKRQREQSVNEQKC